jgi:protein gp37
MGAKSNIEWTDASWTPIRARNLKTGKVGWHCEHATTGCEFCYAEGMNKRLGTGLPFKPGHRKDVEIFLDETMLTQPLRWKKPRTIFVCSMTDLFADFVPDEWIDRIFAVMALTPRHTYQVLTKRAKRMREHLAYVRKQLGSETLGTYECIYNEMGDFGREGLTEPHPYRAAFPNGMPWPLPNVWLGVSAERQQEWDERKEDLCNTPAAIRFVSFEPLLGTIVEPRPLSDFIQWAIIGGESGPNARPMHPDWARTLRDQCAAANAAFFFKQWGEFAPRNTFSDEKPDAHVYRVGKKAAGRLLDGIEYNAMPETA